jgi:5-methylthioadenosine/S-adenosylhomocysteine deaminase
LLRMLDHISSDVSTSDRVRLAIAPTIPAQCTDELLLGCDRLARQVGIGVHTHLAESRVQAVEGLRRYGTTLTQHLHKLGVLGPHVVAAHAVWLDGEDTRILADTGVTVAHNPGSNLKLGNGIAPVRSFLNADVTVSIGTDGSASSDNQNIVEAMRMASLVSRIRSVDPGEWLDAPTTLACATEGGAHACAQLQISGRIAPGEAADLVLLRRDSVFLQPANDLHTQLIHSETASAVDTVIVGGEVILRDGRSVRVNEHTVYAQAQEAIDRVLTLNVAEWEFARRLSPYIVQTCNALATTPFPVQALLLDSAG